MTLTAFTGGPAPLMAATDPVENRTCDLQYT